jgi:hypothetical protein
VYRATVTGTGSVETYTGMTGNTFKQRYGAHINLRKNRHKSSFANHIWNLNDDVKPYDIHWNLIDNTIDNCKAKIWPICLKILKI